MDDKLVSIQLEETLAETSQIDINAEQYEVDLGVPEFDASSNDITMDEVAIGDTIADSEEIVEINIEEAVGWAGGNNTIHDNLAGRDAPDQHPITSITGLRSELNQIEALQTVYSDKKQQADYYLWRKDDDHPLPTNPYGLFVSIYPETNNIQVCDGTNDVFGVTVSEAAFVGGQEYTQAKGGTKTGRDGSYCLVVHSGLVSVRCETTVTVGDYVVPNSRGEAEKSKGGYGYLVTAINNINGTSAIISLNSSLTLIRNTSDTVQDLSIRMPNAESNITSVANVANSAYALAQSVKEKTEDEVSNIYKEAEEWADRTTNNESAIEDLTDVIDKILISTEEAKNIALGANSSAENIRSEAVVIANNALAEAKSANMNLSAYKNIVANVDKYAVGEHSQAYSLTWEQAKQILEVSMIYVPTEGNSTDKNIEVYSDETEDYNQEFTQGCYYTWTGTVWNESNANAVLFIKDGKQLNGSLISPYSVVINENAVDDKGNIYEKDTLFQWEYNKENKEYYWNPITTISKNVISRSVSLIRHETNEIALEVTNAQDAVAALNVRVGENENAVQTVATWAGSEEGKYNLATTKVSADDDGASIALVVVKDGTDEELGGARVVLNDSEKGSYIQLDADKINFLSQEFAIYPSDGKGNKTSNEANFSVDAKGDVNIKGTVHADAGDIGGFNIGDITIASGEVITIGSDGMTEQDGSDNMVGICSEPNHNPWAIWVGEGIFGEKPFRVGHSGEFFATKAHIEGEITATSGKIGGFHITGNHLASTENGDEDLDKKPHLVMISGQGVQTKMTSDTNFASAGMESGNYVFWAGDRKKDSNGQYIGNDSTRPFWVDNNGNFKATSGTIGSLTIDRNIIRNNDSSIQLIGDGESKIAGWKIKNDSFINEYTIDSLTSTISLISFPNDDGDPGLHIRSVDDTQNLTSLVDRKLTFSTESTSFKASSSFSLENLSLQRGEGKSLKKLELKTTNPIEGVAAAIIKSVGYIGGSTVENPTYEGNNIGVLEGDWYTCPPGKSKEKENWTPVHGVRLGVYNYDAGNKSHTGDDNDIEVASSSFTYSGCSLIVLHIEKLDDGAEQQFNLSNIFSKIIAVTGSIDYTGSSGLPAANSGSAVNVYAKYTNENDKRIVSIVTDFGGKNQAATILVFGVPI